MTLTLKAPGSERLKLKYDALLSNVAFNFNLRRYTVDVDWKAGDVVVLASSNHNPDEAETVTLLTVAGRGLHSSTFQLNLSRF